MQTVVALRACRARVTSDDTNASIGWVGCEVNRSHLEGERTATAIVILNLIRPTSIELGKERRLGVGVAGLFLGNHDLVSALDGARVGPGLAIELDVVLGIVGRVELQEDGIVGVGVGVVYLTNEVSRPGGIGEGEGGVTVLVPAALHW